MGTVTAVFSAAANGFKVFLALFGARNSPAMQDNARAATMAKVHASVQEHVAAGDTAAVEEDIAQ